MQTISTQLLVANLAKQHDRFTADTAAKTGQSERSIQRDAERGEKVIPEVIDMITGTKLDTGTYLDKLKKLQKSCLSHTSGRTFPAFRIPPGQVQDFGGVAKMDDVPVYNVTVEMDGKEWLLTVEEHGHPTRTQRFPSREVADDRGRAEHARLRAKYRRG